MTVNQKFETFIDDLFALKLDQKKHKSEVVQYVSTIETYYTSMVEKYRRLYKKK
jgi:hypothetical protein